MGYKILLADDSVTVQKIITLTFSDEGVDVLTVNNGDEALHRLQYLRPALVMADVSIPGKNGYEICEFVKNHPEMKDTPVVLLVPAFEPFDEERARRIGANHHLTKPFQSIRTLISTVKGLLESNPPKITTPLTNSGALPSTGPFAKPATQPASELATETGAKVRSNAAAHPVQDTQPFPPDLPELPALPDLDEGKILPAAADDVLGIEAELSQLEPEPVESPILSLPVESLNAAAPELVEPELLEFEAEKVEAEIESIIAPIAVQAEATAPELEVFAEEPIPAAPAVSAEKIIAPAVNGHQVLSGDLDHVLDLDDVFPEVWPQSIAATPQIETPPPAISESANDSYSAPVAIPQAVIDEIVSRVVAQLSDKLLGNLAGNLAEKLAEQLAPEVAELVKRQAQREPVAQASFTPLNLESDSLLDLD